MKVGSGLHNTARKERTKCATRVEDSLEAAPQTRSCETDRMAVGQPTNKEVDIYEPIREQNP